jgi:hypothetical protein
MQYDIYEKLLSTLFDCDPFSLNLESKYDLHAQIMGQLSKIHVAKCDAYRHLVSIIKSQNSTLNLDDYPPVPVNAFKYLDLVSIDKGLIVKSMHSSGTSNNGQSKISLDKITAFNQVRALVKIAKNFLGEKRLPMLVIDKEPVAGNRDSFSAAVSAARGFSMLCNEVCYLLGEDGEPNYALLNQFLEKNSSNPYLIFGFTFNIYYHLLQNSLLFNKYKFDTAIILHGGGWKKMSDLSISNNEFKKKLHHAYGIKKVINYYGLVEQTGSIYFECEHGLLHESIFSAVDCVDGSLRKVKIGEIGILKLFSVLPLSYPGHLLLTEDLGRIIHHDSCPCGRLGKAFEVLGRIPKSAIRGCSDAL